MPVYNYKAINRSGKTVKDSLEAASLDSAKSSLRSAGYALLDIKEQGLLDKDISIPFLDKSMGMFLTLTNVFYALWSVDENTVSFYDNRYLILTVPLVFLITLKYSLTIEKDSDGDPVEVLFHDKYLLLLCLFYLVTMMAILYL